MKTISPTFIIVAVIAANGAGCSGGDIPVVRQDSARAVDAAATNELPFDFPIPSNWTVVPPKSAMRLAEYRLVSGDKSKDGELVVFFFGPGQGGDAASNLDRWMSQMQQPDGKPSSERAKVDSWEQRGMKVTRLDIAGTFVAETIPGSGERVNQPDSRMIAAVVATPRATFFVKSIGPAATMTKHEASIEALLKSFR